MPSQIKILKTEESKSCRGLLRIYFSLCIGLVLKFSHSRREEVAEISKPDKVSTLLVAILVDKGRTLASAKTPRKKMIKPAILAIFRDIESKFFSLRE